MMKSSILTAVAVGLLGPGGSPVPAVAQEPNRALQEYLSRMGVSAAELDGAARGRAVVKLLPGANERDVAVFGIVGVSGARDTLRARALDVERLLGASRRRYHTFGNPATPADVAEAALDTSEYGSLRACHPGACDFKLPASQMTAFVQQVDWSSPNAKAQADALMRAGLLRLAEAYREQGNAATVAYADVRGARSGDVFGELVKQSSDLYQYAPELERYLTTYPGGRPAGTRDILYWSEDRLPHVRPTLTLNHVVVYAPPGGTAFVARKQIYASHYFEGGFELLAVVDAGAAGGQSGVWLLALRRFRFDSLPTGVLNVRGRVREQLVEATRSDLERARATIQRTPAP